MMVEWRVMDVLNRGFSYIHYVLCILVDLVFVVAWSLLGFSSSLGFFDD
jgi:hypothetical protein